MKRYITSPLLVFFGLLFISSGSFAQTGGSGVFLFMNEPPSARITAMGGSFISVYDDDPSLGYQNPSLLNASMNNRLSLNYMDYIADITRGYAGYVHTFDKLKTTFNAGIQYADYGNFTATDEIGNITGEFDGAEYAFTIGAGREYINRFSYGANVTFISSRFESYHSNGAALTLAGAYHDSAKGLTATVMFKNVGTQFQTYTPSQKEPLPFDIQAGISKRLSHTPFLFSLVLHDLYRWDIRYDDPNETDQTTILIDSSQQTKEKKYFADKLFLHTIIGTEINIGKNVRISIAYNHQRRQELAVELRKGLSGFSFGAGIRINRFNIGYGRSIYNVAGGVNHLSLGVNLDELFGKRM
ncbi:MAG TPA: type IX secretion system protein PorQ, partial [Chitinophagales bacterium]|nr:type IX secretion system protein PorQ [Chitinophagales bacterium]